MSHLVYSTDQGRMCPECQQPKDACRCGEHSDFVGDGSARVSKETKGRGGKVVTCIEGLHLNKSDLSALCKALKRRCGTGGAVKQGRIEIQGDWVECLVAELKQRGYNAKRSGG